MKLVTETITQTMSLLFNPGVFFAAPIPSLPKHFFRLSQGRIESKIHLKHVKPVNGLSPDLQHRFTLRGSTVHNCCHGNTLQIWGPLKFAG